MVSGDFGDKNQKKKMKKDKSVPIGQLAESTRVIESKNISFKGGKVRKMGNIGQIFNLVLELTLFKLCILILTLKKSMM